MAKAQFATQFRTSFQIHEAINAAVSQSSSGSLDPAEIVRHLLTQHPDPELSPAELAEAVAQAAAAAGVRLAYRAPAANP
jgi:hypothetical protein